MNSDGKQYDGPVLSLRVNATADGSYDWEVALSAADHSGAIRLGYKAAGTLLDLDTQFGQFEIYVHDKDRPVWTPMPPSHRKDIRQSIKSLMSKAMSSIKASNLI